VAAGGEDGQDMGAVLAGVLNHPGRPRRRAYGIAIHRLVATLPLR
jgi:hypothetical protein